ncbi:hypothetical protein CCACVL1_03993, partial [Corchorus capsularis]
MAHAYLGDRWRVLISHLQLA